MGILRDSIASAQNRAPSDAFGQAPAHDAPTAPSGPPRGDGSAQLRRRRDALAEQVMQLHWDLGGLAYEMAIRDHFRLDVLLRRAAVLQERDAELAEIERLLSSADDGTAGSCAECGAARSRGALFCAQCGATLTERMPNSPLDGQHAAPPPEREGSAAGQQ
jgi:hypothetical protein